MHEDQRKAFSLPLSRLIYYFQTRDTSAALILECPFKTCSGFLKIHNKTFLFLLYVDAF